MCSKIVTNPIFLKFQLWVCGLKCHKIGGDLRSVLNSHHKIFFITKTQNLMILFKKKHTPFFGKGCKFHRSIILKWLELKAKKTFEPECDRSNFWIKTSNSNPTERTRIRNWQKKKTFLNLSPKPDSKLGTHGTNFCEKNLTQKLFSKNSMFWILCIECDVRILLESVMDAT